MLPIGEILSQAGRLLRRYPALLLPVVAGALAAQFMVGGASGSVPILVAFWLLNMALTAGLLTMIRAYHLSEMSGWDAFLIGVGRYFGPILAGSLVQAALVFVTLLPIVAWLKASVGIPDVKTLTAGNITTGQAEALIQWASALIAWGAVWGIVFFFLAVWKQAVVAQSSSWLRSWQISAAFVKAHWLPMSGLLLMQGVGMAGAFGLVASRVSLLPELGAVAMLVINCYFTVALMVAILGPVPVPKGENVDATA